MDQTHYGERKINKSFCSIVVDDKLVELIPSRIDYTGEMNGGILSLQIHQIYKNDEGDDKTPDREAILILPKSRTQCITGVDLLLNKQQIEVKIEEEKTAEAIEKEGRKQGKTTIRSVTTPDEQLKIHLGSISYGSEIEITIHIEILSTNSDAKTYQTIIPFSDQILEDDSSFTFSIVVNQIVNIADIDITCSYERSNFEFKFDGSVLTIDKKPIGTIILLTKLEEKIPSVIQNDLHDEYSVISVIPHFLNKLVNSDFIFIVDCSGSMSGSRIRNASECLSTFLHSLPVGCKFNIILFGSNYESVFGYEGLVEYNEENLLRAERVVNNLKANMGGTNLLGPLSTAYEQCESKSKKGNVAQIFLLTDGEIHDTETVFKLVSKNRTKSRIFSIGIGKDADRNLVSGLAVLSFGKFDFVSESSQITDKVINLLTMSLAPAITNVSIHAAENDEIEVVPNPLTPIYDGSLMSIFVKRASKENKINQVLITGNIGDEETEIVIDDVCNVCESSAKKLFALNAINDYEKMYEELSEKSSKSSRFRTKKSDDDDEETNKLKKLKDKIVTLSVENGIISKFTSFIGVEKEPHKEAELSDDSDNENGELIMYQNSFAPPMRRMAARRGGGVHYRTKVELPNQKAAPKMDIRFYKEDRQRANPILGAAMKMNAPERKRNGNSIREMKMPEESMVKAADYFDDDSEKEQFEDRFDRFESHQELINRSYEPPRMQASHFMNNICANSAAPPQQAMQCNRQQNRMLFASASSCSPSNIQTALPSFSYMPEKESIKSSALEKVGAAPVPMAAPKPKIEKNLNGVIKSQDFDGKWKPQFIDDLFEFFADHSEEAKTIINGFFQQQGIKDDNEGECIKSTVVAICVLRKMFGSEQSRWKLIENKALQWLKSKMKSTQWEIEIQKLSSSF